METTVKGQKSSEEIKHLDIRYYYKLIIENCECNKRKYIVEFSVFFNFPIVYKIAIKPATSNPSRYIFTIS